MPRLTPPIILGLPRQRTQERSAVTTNSWALVSTLVLKTITSRQNQMFPIFTQSLVNGCLLGLGFSPDAVVTKSHA